jgi:guanylate kinase
MICVVCVSGTESEEVIRVRLENAKRELEHGQSHAMWEARLVNGELFASYQAFRAQILTWYPSLRSVNPHQAPQPNL